MAAAPLVSAPPAALEALKAALGAEVGEAADAELAAFLKVCDGDPAAAAAKFRQAMARRATYSSVNIATVSRFLRAPSPDRKGPDGCFVLLEGPWGVARDHLGRPIMASIGMAHGSAHEQQQQLVYAMQRAAAHRLPEHPPHATMVVLEVRPREKGAPATFRFPDRAVRTLFDLQQAVYPGALFSTSHFCGLPRSVAFAFKLVKPFMSRESYEAMVLKPSFAHLSGVAPRGSLLTQWGGELDFDLDEYISWRAAEEGVSEGVCPRGQGAAYAPKAVDGSALSEAEASSRDIVESGGVTAKALLAGELSESGAPPRRHGEVEKRGSGRGLFRTVRWKPKLLVLCELGLVYFDEMHASDANRASRIIALGEDTRAERRPGTDAHPHQFAVVTAEREFLFAASAADSADAWVADVALEAEASAASKLAIQTTMATSAAVE